MSVNFREQAKNRQIQWRKKSVNKITKKNGTFNYKGITKEYEHIVPQDNWQETIWEPLQKPLTEYIEKEQIQKHTGANNLLSSWIQCVNLYFPISVYDEFKELMKQFLNSKGFPEISEVKKCHLEYAEKGELSPKNLLGERVGSRGSGQTSPDIAFEVNLKSETQQGLILVENKYTEHDFYSCSALSPKDNPRDKKKTGNKNPELCREKKDAKGYKAICNQSIWGRKYWDYIEFSENEKDQLSSCPAATTGYQLFRQQAMAEGLAQKGNYSLVATCVAYDKNNTGLENCLKPSGISHLKDWGSIFKGKAVYQSWTHQEWVQFVRESKQSEISIQWLEYVNSRYGY